jgi:hypothetical protein
MSIVARFRRWFHCMTHLHCAITVTEGRKIFGIFIGFRTTFVGCDCGEVWLNTNKYEIPTEWKRNKPANP